MWNPELYLQFADERARPFHDLVARIGAPSPQRVIDLGCGPGNLTATLAQRWPGARIEGFDADAAMVAAAQARGLAVSRLDARDWLPAADIDVVISNAVLQWVPEHDALLARWMAAFAPGSWLAFQVPANFGAPSHRLVDELVRSAPWQSQLLAHWRDNPVSTPDEYARLLLDAGSTIDVWETTYLHVLGGDDAVFTWLSGTALRPLRAALDDEAWAEFSAALKPRLAAAYPQRGGVTLLPYRRIFVVAHKR
ncbi:trans-aconitate 2-methyltransferase [Chitiniphilus purpureus]|uniref:Trans-aconitate 2-methyltransferase n=1 Tax=Chitiniphilus purpureus TaxID=2981137 RepID=A0ABY6DL12_9NEIS|nr:trans-aconitate 2-methyltransferase [Chitiniphilus sp. CD1]UXY14156.1 trans-aconitate 2-methyltransferase [Chitiniphilus sp. CD1]